MSTYVGFDVYIQQVCILMVTRNQNNDVKWNSSSKGSYGRDVAYKGGGGGVPIPSFSSEKCSWGNYVKIVSGYNILFCYYTISIRWRLIKKLKGRAI